MYPQGDKLVCRQCGFTRELVGDQVVHSNPASHLDRTIAVHEEGQRAGLPTIDVVCSECGNKTAYWWMRQLRSADESEVRFFRCTECGLTWREYD